MANTGSEITGLFQAQPMGRADYPAFALSSMLHGIGIVMISWVLLHTPVVVVDPLSRNYKVRHLELEVPETAESRAVEALYPNQQTVVKPGIKQAVRSGGSSAGERGAEGEARSRAVAALTLPEGGRGKQILVQPNLQTHAKMAEAAPLPSVLVWTPELKRADTIVPPAPEKPVTADVQTSLELPNQELEMADLPQKAADRMPPVKTARAGNTSPIAVKRPAEVKMPPSTVSKPSSEPTPVAVLSVSDLRMDKGTVALPPVNETKANSNKDGVQGARQGATIAQNGMGEPARVTGNDGAAGAKVADAAQSAQNGFAAGESAEHIQLPKDGKFGVVVVGSSLSDQYPEVLQVWSDRVAYTVYLHVGTPKAWILQYAQLRSADAAAGGTVAHLDAPWPYDILRPNLLSKGLNADALMVHGVLNEAGRLVNLAVAYPQGYIHAAYVLHELGEWQFRPAQQKGKPTAVEVLLIIPEND